MSPTLWRILAIVAFVVYPFASGGLAAWIVRWSGRERLYKRGGLLSALIGLVLAAWFIVTNGPGMIPSVTIVGSAVFVFGMASTGALIGAVAELGIAWFLKAEGPVRTAREEWIGDKDNPYTPPHSVDQDDNAV